MKAAVLYRGRDLLAVDKPAGLSLAASPRDESGAVERLLSALPAEDRPSPREAWRLLHRLDVGTSGVVLLAAGASAHRAWSALLAAGRARKSYLALAWGSLHPPRGVFDAPLGPDREDRRKMAVTPSGKRARTLYQVLDSCAVASLVRLGLETGRTHQIRVHLAHAGHSLLGDDLYGRLRDLPPGLSARDRERLQPGHPLLHAWRIAFDETPAGAPLEIVAPPPADFLKVAARLGLAVPNA